MWACQTFGVEPDVDCFTTHYDMHNQSLKRVTIGMDKEVKYAQCDRSTFIPHRALGRHENVRLSYAKGIS